CRRLPARASARRIRLASRDGIWCHHFVADDPLFCLRTPVSRYQACCSLEVVCPSRPSRCRPSSSFFLDDHHEPEIEVVTYTSPRDRSVTFMTIYSIYDYLVLWMTGRSDKFRWRKSTTQTW